MFCSQCGKQIPDNSNLCEHCGSPIISHTKKETPINNDGNIPKLETHQSGSKRILIVLGVILLIVGLLVSLFFFRKSESDKPTPPVKMVIPTPPVKMVIPTPPVKTLVPKSADETVVPKSTDETVIHKSTDETVIPKSTDETVSPTSPSSSSD